MSVHWVSGDRRTCRESSEKASVSAAQVFRGKKERCLAEMPSLSEGQSPSAAEMQTSELCGFQLQVLCSWVLSAPPGDLLLRDMGT